MRFAEYTARRPVRDEIGPFAFCDAVEKNFFVGRLCTFFILEMNEMGPNSSKSGEFFEIACPMTELQIWLRFLKRRPARTLSDLETPGAGNRNVLAVYANSDPGSGMHVHKSGGTKAEWEWFLRCR